MRSFCFIGNISFPIKQNFLQHKKSDAEQNKSVKEIQSNELCFEKICYFLFYGGFGKKRLYARFG